MNVALGFPIMAQKTRFKKLLAAAAGATTVSAVHRKRQGVRRHHLWKVAALLLALEPRHRSQKELDNVNKRAAACTANVLFLRGGELQFIRHCDIEHTTQDGRNWLLIQVLAIKKKKNVARWRCPIVVPEILDDSSCAYTAIMALTVMRLDGASRPAEACATDTNPLFRVRTRNNKKWRPLLTADMLLYAENIASIVGLPIAGFGGHSFRIGCATNLADAGGTKDQLKARSRWAGVDIGWIYARDTVAQQMRTADAIARASSASVEELYPQWVQRA